MNAIFRDRPIRQKLVLIIMATATASLFIAGVSIVSADSFIFRASLRRDLSALARMVAANSTGPLAFSDSEVGNEALSVLNARPHVAGACTYRADGTVFAQYSRASAFTCAPPQAGPDIVTSGNLMTVSEPIVLKGRRTGTLVLTYDLDEVRDRTLLFGGMVLAVLAACSAVAFILASRLRSVVATPIARLVHAASSVSVTGDYGIRAQRLTGDELGILVDRFNEMLTGIERRDIELKDAVLKKETALREVSREQERFRFMADSMPQKIFTATPQGDVDYFNAQWMEFTGLTFEQIRDWGWTQFVHPDDLEGNVRVWSAAIAAGTPFQFEQRFRRFDGEYRWHLSRARSMRDEEENIVLWIGSNTDIHEQKQREAELRRANEDLQQFAYSASHDLQEPIRNVAIYSEIVATRYHALLDADGQQYLSFIREGGRRLATLVGDLLAYTRASMMEAEPAPLDSGAVLRDTLKNLAEAIRESGAAITSDSLPEIYIAEAHLQQVFQNLVGNALKYRGQDQPRIHVAASDLGTAWCFSVRDNGIGIDPQYKEKIFGVFKRLHHSRQFSGTGIGLAICQRVIERYGGRIWVESQLGSGATFRFTVPRHGNPVRTPGLDPAAGGG